MVKLTHCEADLLLLIGQPIVIIEVKLETFVLIGQQLPLQAKQHTEMALAADHPNGETGSLQVTSHLM